MNELDALQVLLGQQTASAFAGEFAALRGDYEGARGNQEAAREAYREALANGVEDEALLRMKLVAVGGQAATS